MGRRRASTSARTVLLLAPLGLIALIFGQGSSPSRTSSPPPVQYVSLPADPPGVEAVATPSAPSQPAASVVPPPETLYVSGHKVPLRAEANGKAAILDRFGPGEAVTVLARSNEWVQVRNERTQREGWIAKKRLRDEAPEQFEKPVKPTISPSVALGTAAIAKLLITASIDAYPSSCACPYQSDRGGRSCGRRSAYSRPGGFAPLCYAKDITPEMVASYRASH
ncbi:hypothetical protein MBLL_00763 (plasmid) [Methylobacterium bullatum]|uniref:SH3b domain-containing protein n=1 Tax=Methylobacterium bullatum TaxID=570505 RepID=A0A679JP47_9HYPH|nr:hypothetical protein MBLL_00763 [Methylobacterium bullatum]